MAEGRIQGRADEGDKHVGSCDNKWGDRKSAAAAAAGVVDRYNKAAEGS